MTQLAQWIIVGIVVAVAAAYLIRSFIRGAKDPCSGCGLASACNKKKTRGCDNRKPM
ncbi:MAG: FeoB-associated Cys-rich membrane protein [Bacteroidales bacterium]|nr:FeoB-associated Cys-rich membrane protein [Bacteroidales bacterium]